MKFFLIFLGFAGISSVCSLQACNSETITRLQGGLSDRHGRLEVCRNGYWRRICSRNFGQVDATVVCRELGFSDQGARLLTRGFERGSSQGQWQTNIMCVGGEESVLACPTKLSREWWCPVVVGIQCEHPVEGELRVLGGKRASAGRIEVYSNGTWGTVCDDFWSSADARVACRQLGYSTEGAQSVRTGFRKRQVNDTTPIALDNLVCGRTESRLIDCKSNGLWIHNCNHNEDAGLICQSNQGRRNTTASVPRAYVVELLQSLLEN